MTDDPSVLHPAVEEMRRYLSIVGPLMGGTLAMREAATLLMPRWPNEDEDAYKTRLQTATLLPAYSETVANMGSRVFAEPLQLGDDVPKLLTDYWQDIDQQGNDGTVFGRRWFEKGVAEAIAFAVVDFPRTEGALTMADLIAEEARPYVVMVGLGQVLGWREHDGTLLQFRYMERVEEPEGRFGQKVVEQIRVLEPGAYSIYRTNDKGEWTLYEEGSTTSKKVPVVPFYPKRTGFMCAKPALLELAHLNVKHWQSQSDQDNILHVARVPMLAILGGEDTVEVTVGANTAIHLPPDADVKYIEHTGQAINAGRQSLLDIEDQMRMAGAKLLVKDSKTTKTVAQSEQDATVEMSPLQMMATMFEDAYAQLLQFMAEYIGEKEGGHVQARGNFEADYALETTLPILLNMAAQGRLSDETLFSEVQRRGVISGERDWATEQARINDQGPPLGSL